MTTETDPTRPDLKAQYASKVAGDIDENEADQRRVEAQIQALQEQLVSLKADRELLMSVSAALLDATTAAKATVPAQSAGMTVAKTSPRPKPAAKKKQPSVREAEDRGAALTDLILGHLSEQHEPRSTSEILRCLAEAHPKRQISDPLVRTSAERLVARGKLVRSKQGAGVYYTVSSGSSSNVK
ncbi:hypothetical protein [Streptomyces sp. NPDC058579]|uniref:hypothetical protein n=1 Tax=Streptomyces sp. NPDC058579 TaxID=3346548 RepID=UPI0036511B35